jgi:hypothetical protein
MIRLRREAGGASRSSRALAVCALALAAATALAQQSPTPAQDQPQQPQEPGAGAQVHTGTNVGVEADTQLENLLADHQFLRVQSMLGTLPPQQAQFYGGILANRDNDPQKSIQMLEPLLNDVVASGDKAHEKLLRKALAEDYLREGNWSKAAQAYQALEARVGSTLTADEQAEIEMPLKMLPLAAANPPMTVDPCEPFELQVDKDPLGLTDLPVYVDARPHSWMLDPTAPFNLIARSLAREAGLKISDESTTIHTLTGKPIVVHSTVIPRFTVGGRLTLRNMTAFVYDDADYFFPRTQYQVEGVLGYAALQALGSLTITADDTVEVVPGNTPAQDAKDPAAQNAKDSAIPAGARFFLDGERILVAFGDARSAASGAQPKPGDERMYEVDAGGQETYLTARYYDEHTADFAGKQMSLYRLPGPVQMAPTPAYLAETVPLAIGSTLIHINYVQVFTQPLGTAGLDDVYGVLGVDALDQFKAYTFNYRTMRFSVRPE